MPIRVSIPLPGPFSYSPRAGGGSGKGLSLLLYVVLVAWWWLPLKWLAVGAWRLCLFLGRVMQARLASRHP